MATLLCDVHIWSIREDQVLVRDTDFSCFKYYDKGQQKSQSERPYAFDKMTYANGRGLTWFVEQGPQKRPNPNGKRLRSNLKELEEILAAPDLSVVLSQWRSSTRLQLMFSNGCIANLFLDKLANVERIVFDKFLVGKLLDYVTDVAFSDRVMIVSYLESRVTIVSFGKDWEGQETLAQADPKITVVDMLGPPGKRLQRRILLSEDSSLVAFWWPISGQEVFPWAPHLKEEDRANVMLYSLKNPTQPSRLGFTRTHTDPVGFK